MNRTAAQAMLAELAWKRGTADGEAMRRLEGGVVARPEIRVRAPRIALADLRGLARQAGEPRTPADDQDSPDGAAAGEEAYELAGDAYASAHARAARGEDDAVSPRVRYLPGWPVDTGGRSGYLAGPATLDGHPRVLFEDGTEETLPRAAITGMVVFLIEEGDPVAVPALNGDVVVSPSEREALAVSAGMLVTPVPELDRPETPHSWPDNLLTAALFDAQLKKGRPLEDLAHDGFSAAVAARDQAPARYPRPEDAGYPVPGLTAGGSPAASPQSRLRLSGPPTAASGRSPLA